MVRVAVLGDSRAAGSVLGSPSWYDYLASYAPDFVGADVHNFAVGSQTLAIADSLYTTTAGPIHPTNGIIGYLFIVLAAVNDFEQGATAAATYTHLLSLAGKAVADGWHLIIATEPPAMSLSYAQDVQRGAYNNLIAGGPQPWESVARVELACPDTNDGTIYLDGAHFTPAGAKLVANVVALAMVAPRNRTYLIMPANTGDQVAVNPVLSGSKMTLGAASDQSHKLNVAGGSTDGFPIISLQDTDPGGHTFWLYARANGLAGRFGIYDATTNTWVTQLYS